MFECCASLRALRFQYWWVHSLSVDVRNPAAARASGDGVNVSVQPDEQGTVDVSLDADEGCLPKGTRVVIRSGKHGGCLSEKSTFTICELQCFLFDS